MGNTPRWQVERDEEGLFVAFGSDGPEEDEVAQVYLSQRPAEREHALEVIARALNRARIPDPHRRVPKGGRKS